MHAWALCTYILLTENAPHSEYMPSPEAQVGPLDDERGIGSNSLSAEIPYETCDTKGCVRAGKTLVSAFYFTLRYSIEFVGNVKEMYGEWIMFYSAPTFMKCIIYLHRNDLYFSNTNSSFLHLSFNLHTWEWEPKIPMKINQSIMDFFYFSAAALIANMDESVDPCDNFYQFACGGFVKSTIIPDDKTQMTTFGMLNDKLDEQLRMLVEEPPKADEPKVFKLIKNLYQSCMNKCKFSLYVDSL